MNYRDMTITTNAQRSFNVTAATICSIFASLSAVAAGDARWHFEGDLSERAVAVAEGLAVRETSGFVADPATTRAFVADLDAIYAIYPGLAAATPWAESANSIIMAVDQSADRQSIESAFAEFVTIDDVSFIQHGWIVLHFAETINASALADWAPDQIEGVHGAVANTVIGDGNDVIYHAKEDLYAFKIGEGDCASGCIDEYWRFVLMSADGPVEIGSAELEVVFSGELSTVVSPTLKVAPGDWLAVGNLARGSEVEVVRENASGRELMKDAYIDFGSASSVGTYAISVHRPYGLAPVVHTVEVSLCAGANLMSGERFLNGWVNDADFGWVYDQSANWIYHADHGWLYMASHSASPSQAWAFDHKAGWLSLDRNAYPWVYGSNHGWMYYQQGSHAPRYFYKTATASWWTVE